MSLLESSQYGLWIGKQTAKETQNATPGKRLVQVGGDFGVARDDGSENFSDLGKYGDKADWVNSMLGQGEPVIQGTPTELAYLLWLFHGAETVTAVVGPPATRRHRFVPSSGLGHYCTAYVRVGQSVIRRHAFVDSIITKIVIEASVANKALHVIPSFLSLDPAVIFTTDPTAAMPTEDPLLYTEGVGAFEVDGTVYKSQTQFSLTIDDAWGPVFGDDTIPYDLVQGQPSATIAVTLFFDADQLARWNLQVYGTASPTAGTKPLRRIPDLGSYDAVLTQKDSADDVTGNALTIAAPSVQWNLPDAPGPNPDGGVTEIQLTGDLRPSTGNEVYTIDVHTDDAVVAFTT
jgi:hypothetical protein